jgi:hypothetical protein
MQSPLISISSDLIGEDEKTTHQSPFVGLLRPNNFLCLAPLPTLPSSLRPHLFPVLNLSDALLGVLLQFLLDCFASALALLAKIQPDL